jgi:hypothetical protein
LGEVYAVFDDIKNIHMGVRCKIKNDFYLNGALSAFDKNDLRSDTIGYDGSSIVYLANYKYMMRLH